MIARFTEPTKYQYQLNIKLNHIYHETPANKLFPNIEDLMISSKVFDDFEDAVTSVNELIAECVYTLNTAVKTEQFSTMSEINPAYSDEDTLSTDWEPAEMSKLWIIDKAAQKLNPENIRAVGLAQLMEVQGAPVMLS